MEQYGCRVTGVTLSPVQRDYGLKWAERRGVSDRLTIDLLDVMDLPYPKESFDRITFLESIIHMPEKDLLFARCYELLKPGGMIFVQE
ncbi:MAG: class I SAM-dependent methyltransferase, partial [Nitrospirae bacterium]|nr:class I SAM-dependent methyltransferase [Nitrospirota bacterium]